MTIREKDRQFFTGKRLLTETEARNISKRLEMFAKSTTAKIEKDPGSATEFYVDAGTKNNGKPGLQDTVIVGTDGEGKIMFEHKLGDTTNNNGEIRAIISILELIDKNAIAGATVYSDSQIAVNWTKGGKTKDSPNNQPFVTRAHELLKATKVALVWIPRAGNKAGQYIEKKYSL